MACSITPLRCFTRPCLGFCFFPLIRETTSLGSSPEPALGVRSRTLRPWECSLQTPVLPEEDILPEGRLVHLEQWYKVIRSAFKEQRGSVYQGRRCTVRVDALQKGALQFHAHVQRRKSGKLWHSETFVQHRRSLPYPLPFPLPWPLSVPLLGESTSLDSLSESALDATPRVLGFMILLVHHTKYA